MIGTDRQVINGVDVQRLHNLVDAVSSDPRNGQAKFNVVTAWRGGMNSRSRVDGWEVGGHKLPKDFQIDIDEPAEACGSNTQPNPQEYLLAAFNACMMVGYVAGASLKGIELDSIEIETEGKLDLRGFLGLDPSVKAGHEQLHYTVRISGNGTPEQFQEIHEMVKATSPNRWTVANPVKLTSELVIT